jgi:hypothetical protein
VDDPVVAVGSATRSPRSSAAIVSPSVVTPDRKTSRLTPGDSVDGQRQRSQPGALADRIRSSVGDAAVDAADPAPRET